MVTSKVKNPESRSREIFLTVILPETAFISRFAIELGGKFFFGKVQKKENAWIEYQEAVSEGRTAGKNDNIEEKGVFLPKVPMKFVQCRPAFTSDSVQVSIL